MQPLDVGRYYWDTGSVYWLNGRLDDVRFYDVPLRKNEIAALANDAPPPIKQPLFK